MPHLHLPAPRPAPAFLPRDACCAAALHTLPATAPVRRTKLADLDPTIHCSIVGTCLGTSELRKLIARHVPGLARNDALDIEIHHVAVSLSTEGGSVAKELNKALDARHALAIKKFGAAKDERALTLLWQEAMAQGDVPGAYWALMTHPASTFDVRTLAFGDVHMLSHLAGASNRADIRRLAALERETVQLKRENANQQARIQSITHQHAAMETQVRDLVARCEQYALVSPQQLRDEVTALRAALAERDDKLALHATRRSDASQQRAAEQAQQDSVYAELLACRLDLDTARAELQAVEQAFGEGGGKATLPRLDGKCVLYVGGRPGTAHTLGKLVAAAGGELLVHDGGIEDRQGFADRHAAPRAAGRVPHRLHQPQRDAGRETGLCTARDYLPAAAQRQPRQFHCVDAVPG
jgi:hypothetical protein